MYKSALNACGAILNAVTARTLQHLVHPLDCIHQQVPLTLNEHGGPLAAQDLTVRDEPHHQHITQRLGLHSTAQV
jgi:hypothetical protein